MWPVFWPWLWWGSGGHLRLRDATMADSARIADIHAESFAHGWSPREIEQMLLDGHVIDIVSCPAVLGEVLTGFAISRVVRDEAELLSIALDPEIRGKRFAARLLARHAARVRQAGAERLFLEVADDNAAALALYRRQGFTEIGRRKNYYPGETSRAPRRDAVTMQWDLRGIDPVPRAYV